MEATETVFEKSPYRIVDHGGFRRLKVEDDETIWFSCMRLNDPDAIVSPYLAVMLQWMVFMPRPKDVVEIGLGGGQVAKFIHKHLPDTRFVAVEVDPGMVHIARHYFGLAADDDRLSVVLGDGGAYVRSHPESCDVMLIDACDSEGGFPESMRGEEFSRACHDALRTEGPLVINLVRKSEPWRAEFCCTLAQFFPVILVVTVTPEQYVLMAFKRLPRFDWALLSQRAQMLEPQLQLGLPDFLTIFEACVKGAGQGSPEAG